MFAHLKSYYNVKTSKLIYENLNVYVFVIPRSKIMIQKLRIVKTYLSLSTWDHFECKQDNNQFPLQRLNCNDIVSLVK